jgi:hypothetical protein
VLVGLVLIGCGIAGSAAAITHWGNLGFGPLDPRGTIRIVLPSATLVALGALWIFTGLVASLLTLRTLHPGAPRLAEPEAVGDDTVDAERELVQGR